MELDIISTVTVSAVPEFARRLNTPIRLYRHILRSQTLFKPTTLDFKF